ncbi:hypothetical protein [Sphingomonas sp. PB4P5]|uniref:hypothetical protein n=1 Tax=Parasphingomonas puruogangriensis TaxID=3096155 RepID=UPI002FC8274B
MRDDFLGRDWADNHHSLSDGIHKLFKTMAIGLQRLNAYQFDAPWKHAPRRDKTAR